jgi:hypothetical protein
MDTFLKVRKRLGLCVDSEYFNDQTFPKHSFLHSHWYLGYVMGKLEEAREIQIHMDQEHFSYTLFKYKVLFFVRRFKICVTLLLNAAVRDLHIWFYTLVKFVYCHWQCCTH